MGFSRNQYADRVGRAAATDAPAHSEDSFCRGRTACNARRNRRAGTLADWVANRAAAVTGPEQPAARQGLLQDPEAEVRQAMTGQR